MADRVLPAWSIDEEYTVHQPPEPEVSPFCDTTTDLTREHVWPDWYSKWLRVQGFDPYRRRRVARQD